MNGNQGFRWLPGPMIINLEIWEYSGGPLPLLGSGFGIDWTLGEMMVVSGTMTDSAREKAEGYLAHKWGIALTGSVTLGHLALLMRIIHQVRTSPFTGARAMGAQTVEPGKTLSPLERKPKLALWLDASDLSTAGSTWSDKSGNGNHATKTGTPTLVTKPKMGIH